LQARLTASNAPHFAVKRASSMAHSSSQVVFSSSDSPKVVVNSQNGLVLFKGNNNAKIGEAFYFISLFRFSKEKV
jgi:flagellar basal body P-ring protein FlgI